MRSRPLVTAAAIAALLAVPALAQESNDPGIEGVEIYEDLSYDHVSGPIDYDLLPPAGGPHSPMWQNCGVYDEPVITEQAVHSLEHGAVWITYRPGLPAAALDRLEKFAEREDYLLVSPWPGQDEPIVASAWGAQLRLDDVNDPRLRQFIRAYARNGPERGAPCTGASDETLPMPAATPLAGTPVAATPAATPAP